MGYSVVVNDGMVQDVPSHVADDDVVDWAMSLCDGTRRRVEVWYGGMDLGVWVFDGTQPVWYPAQPD